MSHLNIRTSPEDESHLSLLREKWGTDRSQATRKALALAAEVIEAREAKSREQLIDESEFISSWESEEINSSNYKEHLKKSMRKKHGTQ